MDNKINVKICTGTVCYVMGGAELQLLEEHLSDDLARRVEITGSPCLDFCNKGDSARAPFAMVGDTVVSEASISKVIIAIKEQINNQDNGR